MMRSNDDSWDLKTGVGATATMVAAARAVASTQADPVINDPYAEVLVRAVGLKLFTQIVDGVIDFSDIEAGWLPLFFGVRSRAFDDFATEASCLGIRQVVVLASGLDSRAYRLDWPPAMAIYEVDQPAIIDWKQGILPTLGRTSAAQHYLIGIDLRQDWPNAMRQRGFKDDAPTAWIVEGLLVGYLPSNAHDELLDTITVLSASGSRIVADHVDTQYPDLIMETLNELHDVWVEHDPTLNLRSLTFPGPRDDPALYLAKRGWKTHNASFTDLLHAIGRPAPGASEIPASSRSARFLNGIRD